MMTVITIGCGLNLICALLTIGLQVGSGHPNLAIIIWAVNASIWTVAAWLWARAAQ